MIEVVVEIDGRPLSRWGCDGVVCATPTGSTAYAFSAGGPVVWPEVEALLCVPISAHALFARPLVVAPSSVIAVELVGRVDAVSCGPTGAAASRSASAIASRCGAAPTRCAWRGSSSTPVHRPAGRQVRPARPRVAWPAGRPRVIEELRIRGLGVIDDAVLELGPGLTVVTGETGAGKTMVVTALGLLLGGRADAGAVRAGAARAAVEGRVVVDRHGPVARRAEEAGAELDDDGALIVARSVTAEGRSRAHLGGRSVPVGAPGRARRGPGRRARPVRPAAAAPAGPAA